MFTQITFYKILGLPLLMWGGIFTFILLLITALVAYLTVKNIRPYPVKLHYQLAIIVIILSLIHGLAAILALI